MPTFNRASLMPQKLLDKCYAVADKAAEKYLAERFGGVDYEEPNGFVRDPVELRAFTDFKRSVLNKALLSAGYTGPQGAVIMAVPQKQVAKIPTIEKEKPAQQKPESVKERKFPLVQSPHGEWRDGTVTYRVYQMQALPANKALTLKEMHEKLCAEFATGEAGASTPEQLLITLRCQLQRQGPARGFKLGRDAKGRLSMHIEGYDKTRVLSAEQLAEKAKREAAKAEAKAEKEKAKAEAKAAKLAEKAAAKAKADAEKAEAAAKAAAEQAKKDAELAKIKALNDKAKSAAPAKK